MRVVAVVACLVGASCSYSVSFQDCTVSCGAGNTCPDGFACNSDGLCRIAGAVGSCPMRLDANGAGDASADAAGSGGIAGIYVADFNASQILVFADGPGGGEAPGRTIAGANTMLARPCGVAVDHAGELVVANVGAANTVGVVTVYPAGADGNVSPARVLAIPGGNTNPFSVAIGSDDGVFVGVEVDNLPRVFHFPPGATASDRNFIDAAAPPLGDPYVAVDAAGNVIVTDKQQVDTFPATAAGSADPIRSFVRPVTGNVPAVAAIAGAIAVTEDTGQIDLFDAQATGSPAIAQQLGPSQIVHAATEPSLTADTSGGSPVFYATDDQQSVIFIVPTTGSGTSLTAGTVREIFSSVSFEACGIAIVP